MHTLISVIVPVYKAEKYLEACVTSILSQSYRNIEVILVDDGSPDLCPALCDELAKQDPRVKVIHKANGGASSARNAGLDVAQGAYLCFVDSDDTLPVHGIEALYQGANRHRAEYVAGICMIGNTGRAKNPIDQENVISLEESPETVLKYLTGGGSYSPYAKLFSGRIVQENQLRYREDLKCSEDALFIRQYMKYCNRLVLVPEPVYFYNTGNEASLSKKGYEYYCEYYIEKLKALDALCCRLELPQEARQAFLTARAIHGLRISTQHYLKNWEASEARKQLICKSVELIRPLLELESAYADWLEADLQKWWKNKEMLIRQNDQNRFFAAAIRDYSSGSRLSALRQCIKRILRR